MLHYIIITLTTTTNQHTIQCSTCVNLQQSR
jgi:hypothetical protein